MTRTPSEHVDAFLSSLADGKIDESEVRPTVERGTGVPPRTFEQWGTAHAHARR